MSIHSVFATQIYQAKCLTPTSPLFRHIQKEIRQIETADSEGQEWSQGQYPNGFTSYGSWDQLHRMSPNFEDLKKKIDGHVKKYIQTLGWAVSAKEIQMTRFWVNIMKPNTIHSWHTHPLSVISGTFYLEIPRGASPIKFEDPRFGLFMGRPPQKAKAQKTHLSLLPKPGELILFESWLRHEVPLNTSPKERVSCSFNYDWVRG